MHLEKETIMRITTRRHVVGKDAACRTGRSLSHLALTAAVVGAIAGVGLLDGGLDLSGLPKIVLCWIGTPIGAMAIGILLYLLLTPLFNRLAIPLQEQTSIVLPYDLIGAILIETNDNRGIIGQVELPRYSDNLSFLYTLEVWVPHVAWIPDQEMRETLLTEFMYQRRKSSPVTKDIRLDNDAAGDIRKPLR